MKTQGLAFGKDRCILACLLSFKVFTLKKEDNIGGVTLILVMAILGLHIGLNQLQDEATL